jgi:DNA repair protein RecO (recombination protein O)
VPTYSLTAVNVGSFALGEADKVLTLFSPERGLTRAVAKGARKPGARIAGRADVLNVNRLMLATGRSLDIITQAEGVETFSNLRRDLTRLAYGLYYAELTSQFGQGLSEEADIYFEKLCDALRLQAEGQVEGALLCLEFELFLLDLIGYRPELDVCVGCRRALTDYNVSAFDHDNGGILCESCFSSQRKMPHQTVSEKAQAADADRSYGRAFSTHLTPLVWKMLILAGQGESSAHSRERMNSGSAAARATQAARRLIQSYIEHRAGKKMKSLDLLALQEL